MWTDRQFWLDTSWRAFRTFCQSLAALLGGSAVNLLTAPWSSMLGIAGGAAVMSVLMSVDRERAVTWTMSSQTPAQPLQAGYEGCGSDLR